MKKLYYGGDIITFDRRIKIAKNVLVNKDVIEYVGNEKIIDTDIEYIDLKGKTLIPGFVVNCKNISEELTIKNGITSVILNESAENIDFNNNIDYYIFPFYKEILNIKLSENIHICGYSIKIDGDLKSKKAYLSAPYYVVPEGELLSYSGICNYKYTELKSIIKFCFLNNISLNVIASGTAAIEQFIKAYEKVTIKENKPTLRCTLYNCSTVSETQLDRIRMLKLLCSYGFDEIIDYGDFFINSVLGENTSIKIDPANTTIKKGIPFTLSVCNCNVWENIYSAVIRRTANNELIDKTERITPLNALRAATINGAYSIGIEEKVGSITPNKFADLLVLNKNPCKVRRSEIKDIKIVETIKKGNTIYKNY